MKTRRARPEDAEAIALLIEHYAAEGLLLGRAREEIRAGIDRFLVAREGTRIAGCVALESYGPRLAEIRSIAVDPASRGRGRGEQLLRAAMAEARRRGYERVFAMTHAREFFLRYGFRPVARETIPEKIERDCSHCPRAKGCRLEAVTVAVAGRGEGLPAPETEAVSPFAS